jgi:hypothetical protein
MSPDTRTTEALGNAHADKKNSHSRLEGYSGTDDKFVGFIRNCCIAVVVLCPSALSEE